MKKIVLFICLSTLLIGCKEKEKWTIENKKYDLKSTLPCEENNCTHVSLEIPTIETEIPELKKINDHIFELAKEKIEFQDANLKISNYNDLMKSFVNSYDEIKKAFPNEPLPWEATISGTSENFNDKCLNIVLNYYSFTGGAHGNEGVNSAFFNLETGKEIPQKDLFLDYEGFKKIVERDFRSANELSETDNINKKGHLFVNDKFSLAQNIIITPTEIILHYNKYEIAPYSSGITMMKFPMASFKKYLNPLYF